MRITEAAQGVQRSGFPEAYEDHAEDARALASALTGYSPGAFTCVVRHGDLDAEEPGERRADRRARARRSPTSSGSSAACRWAGSRPTASAPATWRARRTTTAARSTSSSGRSTTRTCGAGWAVAQYLVANAGRLGIDHVIFDDRIWSSGLRSEQGWRDYDAPVRRRPRHRPPGSSSSTATTCTSTWSRAADSANLGTSVGTQPGAVARLRDPAAPHCCQSGSSLDGDAEPCGVRRAEETTWDRPR